MANFMSQSPLILTESEVSTRPSHVVQIKAARRGITGSVNRLSNAFPGRKLDGGTRHHTHTQPSG